MILDGPSILPLDMTGCDQKPTRRYDRGARGGPPLIFAS